MVVVVVTNSLILAVAAAEIVAAMAAISNTSQGQKPRQETDECRQGNSRPVSARLR